MLSYKTPGVYVEEEPTLPPSVVSVSTAVPAFIGYTRKGSPGNGENPTAVKISSMLEYRALFGDPQAVEFKATVTNLTDGGQEVIIEGPNSGGPELQYIMYHSLELYFANGGGPCYIVSVGNMAVGNMERSPADAKDDFEKGLDAIKRIDEPTLIVLTDAVRLDAYYELCKSTLSQCAELQDRFAIFDVLDTGADASEAIKFFRDNIGESNLKYGAAYFPYLKTSLNYHYQEKGVIVAGVGQYEYDSDRKEGIKVTYDKPPNGVLQPKVKILATSTSGNKITFEIDDTSSESDIILEILGISGDTVDGAGSPSAGISPDEIVKAWDGWDRDRKGFDITINGEGNTEVLPTSGADAKPLVPLSLKLSDLKTYKTASYNAIKQALAGEMITLPPSSAVAGIYAKVDRERGVWKAPANVSLSSVIRPQHLITNEQQKGFNVDATTGKSINIIRRFQGKGTLVWGARTLAGNDNEWRYVSVRRLFNTIEESTQKATSFAVFESNDATTWLKVKALIENYLYGLWQLGALAGAAPEQAYYVQVGLGKTMTTQDVLEGKMNVEIGVAAVRPAEFIILKFSHKMQEA